MDTFQLWCFSFILSALVHHFAHALASYCDEHGLNCSSTHIIEAPCSDPFFQHVASLLENHCRQQIGWCMCKSSLLGSWGFQLLWHALYAVQQFPLLPFYLPFEPIHIPFNSELHAAGKLENPDYQVGCADGLQAALRLLTHDPRLQRYFWQTDNQFVLVLYDGPPPPYVEIPPKVYSFLIPRFDIQLAPPFHLSTMYGGRFQQAPDRFRDEECFESDSQMTTQGYDSAMAAMLYLADDALEHVKEGLAKQGVTAWVLRGSTEAVSSYEPAASGWYCKSDVALIHLKLIPVLAVSINDVSVLRSLEDPSEGWYVVEVDPYRQYDVGRHPWPQLKSTGVSLSSLCSAIFCPFVQVVVFGFAHKRWPTIASAAPQTLAVFLAPVQPCVVPVAQLHEPISWRLPGDQVAVEKWPLGSAACAHLRSSVAAPIVLDPYPLIPGSDLSRLLARSPTYHDAMVLRRGHDDDAMAMINDKLRLKARFAELGLAQAPVLWSGGTMIPRDVLQKALASEKDFVLKPSHLAETSHVTVVSFVTGRPIDLLAGVKDRSLFLPDGGKERYAEVDVESLLEMAAEGFAQRVLVGKGNEATIGRTVGPGVAFWRVPPGLILEEKARTFDGQQGLADEVRVHVVFGRVFVGWWQIIRKTSKSHAELVTLGYIFRDGTCWKCTEEFPNWPKVVELAENAMIGYDLVRVDIFPNAGSPWINEVTWEWGQQVDDWVAADLMRRYIAGYDLL